VDRDVIDAGRLLRFGLQPRLLPAHDQAYRDLVRSWDNRPTLQATTEALADGLGVWVVTVDPHVGIVCCAEADSPFDLRIGEFLRQARAEAQWSQRVVFALALLATWRLCFPRPATLDDPEWTARVSASEVMRYLDRLCDQLDEAVDAFEGDVDPPVDRPQLERAWRAWQRRGRAARTPDGRRSSRTTSALVARALTWMVDQGLLDKLNEDEGGTYRSRPRLRVLVRELAGTTIYEEVLRLAPPPVGGEPPPPLSGDRSP
jgi:hypothetical protein